MIKAFLMPGTQEMPTPVVSSFDFLLLLWITENPLITKRKDYEMNVIRQKREKLNWDVQFGSLMTTG
jgi:hypothetical protein